MKPDPSGAASARDLLAELDTLVKYRDQLKSDYVHRSSDLLVALRPLVERETLDWKRRCVEAAYEVWGQSTDTKDRRFEISIYTALALAEVYLLGTRLETRSDETREATP